MSGGAPETAGLITPSALSAAQPSSGPTSGFPRIDKYELLEEIGHGGMATVYRARDPRLGREVAVKVIHKHLRENPEVGTRFVAEARAAAKLRHPGIVDVFDVSSDDDPERYLVVELIRGTTLRKVLQKHRDMPAEIGSAIVLHLCAALDHAHASGIVHRDVKPENVLVELPSDRASASGRRDPAGVSIPPDATPTPVPTSEPRRAAVAEASIGDTQRSVVEVVTARPPPAQKHGEPRTPVPPRAGPRDDGGVIIKITDFGIAKILDAASMTSTGQVLGSPAHMAPEQIEGGDIDARTDVFALGVLMYECLVGHLPFEGKNPAQVLRRVLEGNYAPADRERPTVGGRWSRLVARALARDVVERTASAAELGDAIRAELAAVGIDDPKREIDAYFADPEGYASALSARLVPRLIARGEAARESGDVPGAAADFNRALALHPDDLAILKRIGKLTSSAGRRRLARRAAAIVAGSAALGIAAFGAARALKARAGTPTPSGPASAAVTATASIVKPPPSTDGVTATAPTASQSVTEPSGRRPRVPATPTVVTPATPATAGARMVRFNVTPKGAILVVDGARQSWPYQFSLPVGPHQVQLEMAPKVERCCKKLATRITVDPPPATEPDKVQDVALSMEIQPATVTLSNAPVNGQISCVGLGLTLFAGSSAKVKMRDPQWFGGCSFTGPDKPARQAKVTINAGEVNLVPWPAD